MLLDEPFGALDALTRSGCTAAAANCAPGTGPAVLLVTHDVDEAIGLADRVLVLDRGVIGFAGPPWGRWTGRATRATPPSPRFDRQLLTELGVITLGGKKLTINITACRYRTNSGPAQDS